MLNTFKQYAWNREPAGKYARQSPRRCSGVVSRRAHRSGEREVIVRSRTRVCFLLAACVALFGTAWVLTNKGVYGLTLFLFLPLLVGMTGTAAGRPETASVAAWYGAGANIVASLAFLLLGIEGIICSVMALPLAMPLGALGGWLEFARQRAGRQRIAMLLLLPAGGGFWGFDMTAKPELFEVRTSVEIAAAPETVWKQLVEFSDLPEPHEWYFKRGLAYPLRARIVRVGTGGDPLLRVLHGAVCGAHHRVGCAAAAAVFRDFQPCADARMEPVCRRSTETLARLHGFQAGPIPPSSDSRRWDAAGRNHLVSTRLVARHVLALMVRRDHSPHSPARSCARPRSCRSAVAR